MACMPPNKRKKDGQLIRPSLIRYLHARLKLANCSAYNVWPVSVEYVLSSA